MKTVAKVTSHMEGDPKYIWIVKGKAYDLELLYRFTNEQGETHFIKPEQFNEFFIKEED